MSLITPPTKPHITSTPEVCGGRPVIAGTRIRVFDVYIWHEKQGKSPDQIVHEFPQLSLGDVYAALAYFWDHRDAMLAQIEEDRRLVESMKQKHPSRLQEKLQQQRNDGASIPS